MVDGVCAEYMLIWIVSAHSMQGFMCSDCGIEWGITPV